MDLDKLREAYQEVQLKADELCRTLRQQIEALLSANSVQLGVPIESRVKSWNSIQDKIQRRNLIIEKLTELGDLVGLRVIVLFRRDVDKLCSVVERTFQILEKEDTSQRLDESQFGYHSVHYTIRLPQQWLTIPSLSNLAEFRAELQIRTMSQHMWDEASHFLQYKQESNVPDSVRRSIHRVSALLETVDLEFERVLQAREQYVAQLDTDGSRAGRASELLNVDSLRMALDSRLPSASKGDEDYSTLLSNLNSNSVLSIGQLNDLIDRRLTEALKEDAETVAKMRSDQLGYGGYDVVERMNRGVFLNHTGLVRSMLINEFGVEFRSPKPPKGNLAEGEGWTFAENQ